jgi:hypothetical protein
MSDFIDAAYRKLRQIPGIGPLVATAIVASIGNGAAFRKGREFAAWLGLLPKQHSTGGKAQDPDSWSPRSGVAIQAGPNRDGRLDDLA